MRSAFSANCGMKIMPIITTPVMMESRSVMTMFGFLKYARFMTGSAARRSTSTNRGSSTTNAMRNG